ncbi:ATP-binding protein [Roseofilum sp. BLCC_M154]|uniref:histidine kinase n=1 Tax=Roseofilum acuticapitatum BLCC-M154 TaxID=3022444 RepID=A0ABT7AYI3_9CYAN|nr:ATP-binding protein [Roseofilum acuticapitatum]MDJ1171963.1 ATP-binding protein [Roseofilum acuticapitatum BLCC-M154]
MTALVKKILIVEDELIAAHNLADNIKELGYEVSGIVKTGKAAIDRVINDPPNLILMDIKLQGDMSGIEAARALQDYDIPIIYLTAFSDTKTLEDATETLAYGYLNKPAKLEDIKSAIALSLAKHQKDRKMASLWLQEKKLSELKSRFVSMISHDLRAPLTHILVSLEILRQYGDELNLSQKSKQFDRMQIAIKNMTLQLEEMLTIDRVESGKLPLNPVPIDIVKFCRERLDFFEIIADHKCELKFDYDPEHLCQYLDEDILQHILNNLLSNAIKYSPEGGEVRLTLTAQPDGVLLEVKDRGIGIPPEDLDNLYSPFERATNVGKIKGTGIGLYIVKQAVECHQGTIEVSSQVGVGTTFRVRLPSLEV